MACKRSGVRLPCSPLTINVKQFFDTQKIPVNLNFGYEMGTKNLKGTVSVENIDKRIRLRWRFRKRRFSLNLFHFSKANLLIAREIAFQIENDLSMGVFDISLDRYKPSSIPESSTGTEKTIVEHFEEWVINYRNMDCDRDIDYYSTRNMMTRWGKFECSSVVSLTTGWLLYSVQNLPLPLCDKEAL